MALAAAASPLAAVNHGGEFGVYGDAIFDFCLCDIFESEVFVFCVLSQVPSSLRR